LDYPALGGCPSLLVEPAATNLAVRSEEFDLGSWTKTQINVTANAITAPDGATTADLLIPNTVEAQHRVDQTLSLSSGTVTFSCFFKANGYNFVGVRNSTSVAAINLTNGQVSFSGANVVSASSEPLLNGWYRLRATLILADGVFRIQVGETLSQVTTFSFWIGNGTSGVYAWGAQAETGSVATSYIPTVAATATRNADVISKTGVSGFIGQTEGTLFAEFTPTSNESAEVVQMYANTSVDNVVSIACGNGNIYGVVYTDSSYRFDPIISRTIPNNTFKVAICYKNNDFAFFINGQKVAQSSNSYVPTAPLTGIYLAEPLFFGKNTINYKSVLTFPVRLTDTQAIELTAL
jgi:hypothetical protein